uniref:Serpentine Receptor, class T n=1 Tax=Rhabditophanes sp. KR3021 TaxID=114890 RepID=A0AC35UBA9_9BILA
MPSVAYWSELEKNYKGYYFLFTWTTFDCSMFTQDELESWAKDDARHLLGLFYGGLGIFYILCYIPCILAMFNKEHFVNPCYKLMIFLSFLDIINLSLLGPLTGYLTYHGYSACMFSRLNIVAGTVIFATFSALNFATIILLISRLLEYAKPTMAKTLFEGPKTYFWLLLSTAYGIIGALSTRTLFFCAYGGFWSFDPYTGLPIEHIKFEENYFHQTQSLLYVIFSGLLYLTYMILYFVEISKTSSMTLSCVTFVLTAQVLVISLVQDATHIMFILIFYIKTNSTIFGTCAYFFWINLHGCTSIVLLIFNKSLKKTMKYTYFGVRDSGGVISVGAPSAKANLKVVRSVRPIPT